MSYKIQSINGCTKKLVFNIEKLDLGTEIQAALKDKQKSSNLKGFRKGKAPLGMVQQVYGPQVESDALNRFLQKQYFEAVQKENLRVVGYPSFENVQYKAGDSVSFDARVEIFPEIDVKEFKGLKFEKETAKVSDEEVENTKKDYLNSKVEVVELTDENAKVSAKNIAVINFQGVKADGERPENMKGEDYPLEIGSGQFIPGFEEGLIGMKKGEKKDITLTFPADYHVEELKNAQVKFEVELLEIKEKRYPELNDELAKEFGFENASDFNQKTKERLEKQKERQSREKLNQQILEKLVSENPADVPSTMITQQEQYLKDDVKRMLSQQGFNDKMMEGYFDKWHEDLNKKAKFQVHSGLILDSLAKKFKIEANEEDFNQKVEESARLSGMEKDQLKKYYTSNDQLKKNLMYAIREEKTFDKIIEQVTVKEVAAAAETKSKK